ncbi:MAG: DUF1592 domain-containing protein [Verrucomicrobiota bacterium]
MVAEDRPVMDFLLADYTFLNGTLARHYGVPGPDGEEFVRVSLAERNDRTPDAGEHPDPDLESHTHLAGEAGQMGAGKPAGHAATASSSRGS